MHDHSVQLYHSDDFTMDTASRSTVDARLTDSENARSKQLLVVPTESLTNTVWLEWRIRMSKAQLVFRYEISDLLYM